MRSKPCSRASSCRSSSLARLRLASALALCGLAAACSGPEADYVAVYQVVPDAHVLYLGNHWYVARDNDGGTFLVKVNDNGEASSVERIF